nr:MAG TPA: Chitin oligosaccharide deacetylase [Bacteriophage sp.]
MTEKSLLVTARALDLNQDWVMRLHVACELSGVEYTRELGVEVTYALSDRMTQNGDLTINFEGVTDDMILEAVATYEPPVVEGDPTVAEAVQEQVEVLARVLTSESDDGSLARKLIAAQGIEEGDEWVQPTHALNTYPKGWRTVRGGVRWESTVDHNVWEPGVSGWRIVVEDEIPPWQQSSGAHEVFYNAGDRVAHHGKTWTSLVDNNVWEPGAMGSETAWAEDPDD